MEGPLYKHSHPPWSDPPMTMTAAELNAAKCAEAERRRLGHRYYDDPYDDDDGYVSPPPPASNNNPPPRGYYRD
ncbi:hypothetical protein FRC12_007956 [Ceratobasidium sp. 428]|nr:hypothetical protein FRC12_007956 [Ceratobasidium sp. 428]